MFTGLATVFCANFSRLSKFAFRVNTKFIKHLYHYDPIGNATEVSSLQAGQMPIQRQTFKTTGRSRCDRGALSS